MIPSPKQEEKGLLYRHSIIIVSRCKVVAAGHEGDMQGT